MANVTRQVVLGRLLQRQCAMQSGIGGVGVEVVIEDFN